MPSIPLNTRFIGIAPQVTLYERKTSLLNAQTQPYTMADFIASTGGGAISVTLAEVTALINDGELISGAYYLISGVDAALYGGTTILIQAATANTLALAGHGIFYNPKYLNSQATPNNGYGIWSNYVFLTFSNIVGTFTNGDTVTANNGATATYLAQGFLSWISGDWSLATSIDNGAVATADVSGGVSPSYSIGQDVIWGGKHWNNTSGNIGTADDKYTLSLADWTAVPFNSTDYNVEIDIIHYDYLHDMIIRRKDKWNNDVDGNFAVFTQLANPDGINLGNPIKDFQWGNNPEDFNLEDENYIGVFSNYVKDSYLECINFIGNDVSYNILTQQSYIHNNITDVNSSIYSNVLTNDGVINNSTLTGSNIGNNRLTKGCYLSNNTLTNSDINSNTSTNNSSIGNNTLTSNSNINNNTLTNDAVIQNNTLTSNSNIFNNTLTSNSNISYNTLNNNCRISNNTLTSSNIHNNTLTNSDINNNTLTNDAVIQNNTLTSNGYINSNTLTNSYIQFNTLTSNSNINSNTLTNSYIQFNTLTSNSYINNNTLNNSTFNFSSSGTLSAKDIQSIEANYANAGFDISAATIIYGDYSKQMFKNSAGTTRLGYYNASDVFTVVNVNA